MFESDDFDQVLSQFEFPGLQSNDKENENSLKVQRSNISPQRSNVVSALSPGINSHCSNKNPACSFQTALPDFVSPKHSKRKIIDSFFDTKSKRKFPGPAGLLTGSLQETKNDEISHIEFLSQDIEFSQNHLRNDIFESPLWTRLLQDIKVWGIDNVDCIKTIKHQALSGNLRHRKAQTITAFVEAVDRSATDPLIILKDKSGHIKCTLHRDAWHNFSSYIAAEYCALILIKPTVLTTGSAFKKHYLNITLSNIYAIYSSAVLKDLEQSNPIPDAYQKIYEENFTIIKTDVSHSADIALNLCESNISTEKDDHLDGLDSSLFLDEIF